MAQLGYTHAMAAHQCPKCSRTFGKAYNLDRHLARKIPCDSFVEDTHLPHTDGIKRFCCNHCGRRFTSKGLVCRHVRKRCKAANVGRMVADEVGRLRERFVAQAAADRAAQTEWATAAEVTQQVEARHTATERRLELVAECTMTLKRQLAIAAPEASSA